MPSSNPPYRVKIIGATHPHRGSEGTADPKQTAMNGQLVRVSLENGDVDACYCATNEMRRI